ncbi:MAG TPA: formate/nitrite transporter family protein [Rhodanobacteraceae bacterium]|nr:formate/nitrite transporter family protein [Rhodanobacteraceae bacterium]
MPERRPPSSDAPGDADPPGATQGAEGREGKRDQRDRHGLGGDRAEAHSEEKGFSLSRREKRDVAEKLPPRATVLHEAIRVEGEAELKRKPQALVLSAIAAGLSLGFSMLAKALLYAHLGDFPARFVVVSLGYTVGFLVVVLARQQLFTEITMTAVLPVMTRPSWRKLLQLLRMWGLVFLGNLLGVALFAWAISHLDLFQPPVRQALLHGAHELMQNTPIQMFDKAIFAGWLLATMVWLLPAAEQSRALVVIALTYLIALGGFTHVIVGSTEALYLVFRAQLGFGEFLWHFMLPTLAGNIVGGSLMFALLSHAQVRSDEEDDGP